MKTLKEGTWYIKGCKELDNYFDKNNIGFAGDIYVYSYYIEDGKWDFDIIEKLRYRSEITLQDYLDSLKQELEKIDNYYFPNKKESLEKDKRLLTDQELKFLGFLDYGRHEIDNEYFYEWWILNIGQLQIHVTNEFNSSNQCYACFVEINDETLPKLTKANLLQLIEILRNGIRKN